MRIRKQLLIWLAMMVLLCGITSVYAAQDREVILYEDFTDTTFPPDGWTISSNTTNWSRFAGNSAGGATPELRLSWEPQFTGASYFISPTINTAGLSNVYLDFRHFVDYYATPFTVGVAVRHDGGDWITVWSANPTANIGPELKSFQVYNDTTAATEFQFAFFFSGSSYNIDYWFIDNIKLYEPFAYDLAIYSVSGVDQIGMGEAFTPTCVAKNLGTNSLTAMVSLDIYKWDTWIQNVPNYMVSSMDPGQELTVEFPVFVPEDENELYRFAFSISSLEDVIDEDPTNNTMDKWLATWTTAKQQVLLEIGTGGWCPYCPGAAMAADDFIEQEYNVAVIENHNGDPYANDASNARNAYYGITGYPTGVFDGLLRYVGGNNTTSVFPSYLPLYQERAPLKSPVAINIFGTNEGDAYDITVRVDKVANLAYPNLVLHFALTESEIQYSWQGQTHFNFVNQMMLPSHLGTEIDMLNAEIGEHDYILNFNRESAWVSEHCELVAFIQNADTKEVIQANKVALLDLEAPPVSNHDTSVIPVGTKLGSIYPNPFNPQTTIAYNLQKASQVRIDVYNVKGQKVSSLVNANLPSGSHSVTWNGKDAQGNSVSSGIYYVRMNAGAYSSTRKIMLMK